MRRSLPLRSARDEGFSMIELLVIMIIIAILAAVAIPILLAQRTKGYETAVKVDLKNAAIAEETYATDNGGAYATETVTGLGSTNGALELEGYKGTATVTINATASGSGSAATYVITASNSAGGSTYCLNSANGGAITKATTC